MGAALCERDSMSVPCGATRLARVRHAYLNERNGGTGRGRRGGRGGGEGTKGRRRGRVLGDSTAGTSSTMLMSSHT